MQAMNSLLSQQQQSQMSLQDLQNGGNGGSTGGVGGLGQHNMGHSHFDPTSSHDDFLEQILSSVPSSSPWPDLSKSWDPHHHLSSPPHNPSSGEDQPPSNPLHSQFHYDDQASSLLASKLRQHQITGGGAAAAAKALMLQQQFLLSRTLAGNGLRSPNGASGDNGLLSLPLNLSNNGDQNDGVANPANDNSVQALFNGFAGSLGQTSNQPQHFHHPQGGSMQSQSFGAPAMNQTPAASGSAGGGGGSTPAAQPKQQRVRARRGQATDPHSIAERLRRERIAERMKALQELVPNANKTDKASMLDEIIDYVKFLQLQVKVLSMSRLGGAAAVAPLVADMSSEGRGEGNVGRGGNGTAASSSNNETMTVTEHQVAKLMEEDMGSAMQYLQGKGLCLMPISLATAISTSTRIPLLSPEAGRPPSPTLSALTVQSATIGNAAGKDATSLSEA